MEALTTAGFRAWMAEFAAAIDGHATCLTELDAAIGDGDHGTNLNRGMTAASAALAALDDSAPLDETVKKVAMTLVSTVGGASGALYGTFFLRFAAATKGRTELDPEAFAQALRAGVDGVAARGHTASGDKTMLDALLPACDAFETARSGGLAAALAAAAEAANTGRDDTIPLIARKGRASYLGARSAGHLDPGATSAAMLLQCAHDALSATS